MAAAELENADFKSRMALSAEEEYLPSVRNMYFWDGYSRDGGQPKLTLYYSDGQGKKTTGSGEVGIDFYEIKSTAAADEWRSQSISAGRGSGSGRHTKGPTGHYSPGKQGEMALVAGVEANAGGASATDDAYANTYTTTLAWQRLSDWRRETGDYGGQARRQRLGVGDLGGGNRGFVDREAHNSMYELYRPKMLDVVGNVFRNESRIGNIGGSPDTVQSRIQANLRNKLIAEGFKEAWIDVFFAEENILTITPEGFDLHGTDQSRRPIPAGTDPTQIKNMRTNPGDYTTYPAKAPLSPPASRIVVHAPFGYIVPPKGGVTGRGVFAEGDETAPQIVQKFPHNPDSTSLDFDHVGYTLHSLSTKQEEHEAFFFDFAPNNISYQGLGAQWVEIPRAGDLPIVEFASWSLMKVSIDFQIANKVTSSLGFEHWDGLVTGVYEKIAKLRRMAQRPYPVSIFNMDQLLRHSMKRASTIGKPLEFVISDLTVSSIRRTIEAGHKEITTAQVKLTLQEIPVEDIKSVRFGKPNIVTPFIPPDAAGGMSSANPFHPVMQHGDSDASELDESPDFLQTTGVNPASNENAVIGGGQADIVHDPYDEWGMSQ